jgi:RNA polymerase sigma-70 factor (ECF subfamily)
MPVMALEEEQLPVAGARRGDPQAWDALFKRYQLPLYVFVFEMTRKEQTSLDIVQETFVNAVRHIASLKNDEKFGSWLFGIARQKSIQSWRKESTAARIEDRLASDEHTDSEDPSELLIQREHEAEFMKTLAGLTDTHREVIVLHFLQEFSIDEIAGITGAPIGTVKSRLHKPPGQILFFVRPS